MNLEPFRKNHFSEKLYGICSAAAYGAIVLFFLDIILLGTGNLTRIGGLSTRIVFFAVAVIASAPLVLRDFSRLVRQPFVLCVGLFLVWVAVCAIRGWSSGNRMDILKTDVMGYLNFCLLPGMLCVVNTTRRKKFLAASIVAGCAVMAVFAVVLSFFALFPDSDALYDWCQNSGICAITVMGSISTRVVFHTASRLFYVGFALALFFLIKTDRIWKKVLYTALMALFVVGVFLSYSRAFYAGSAIAAAVTVGVLLLTRSSHLKKTAGAIIAAGLAAVVMIGAIGALQGANLFNTAIYRVALSFVEVPDEDIEESLPVSMENQDSQNEDDSSNMDQETEDAEMEGVSERQLKLERLSRSIAANPVFGNGLGASVDVDNGYVEYIYHDILNKMGIVGLGLFVSPFLLMSWLILRRRKRMDGEKTGFFELAGYSIAAYFLFITYFNPCMNTTLGIAHYLYAMTILSGSWPKGLNRETKSQ